MSNIGKHSVQTSLDASGYHSGTLAMVKSTQAMALATGQSYDQVQKTIDQNLAHQRQAAIEQAKIDKKLEKDKAAATVGGMSGAFAALQSGIGAGGGGSFGLIGTEIMALASPVGMAVATVGALTAAVGYYISTGLDAIKMQDRLSVALGVTHAQAAGMIAVGGLAGQTPDQIRSDAIHAMRHIGELRTDLSTGGTGGAAGASLRALGLDAATFAAMGNWQEQLGLVADRLKTVTNANDRASISQAIFGRSWESLLPQMRLGSEGMARAAALATHFGVTVGTEATAAVMQTSQAARSFAIARQLAGEGLRNQLAAGFTEGHEGTLGADYEARTRTLMELQPQLQEGVRGFGRLTGEVTREAIRVWDEFTAAVGRAYNFVSGAPPTPPAPMATPGIPAPGQEGSIYTREEIEQRRASIPAAMREVEAARAAAEDARQRDARSGIGLGTFGGVFASDTAARANAILAEAQARLERATRLVAMADAASAADWTPMTGDEMFQEEAAAQASVIGAIGESTSALQRQVQEYGMATEEIQRMRFVQQNASAADLKEFDEKLAKLRELREATQQEALEEQRAASLQQLATQAESPIEAFRRRMREIRSQGGDLRPDQVGSLIQQAAGRLGTIGPSPLLGGMSAGSSEVGAILQASQSPQVTLLEQLLAQAEAASQAAADQAAALEEIGGNLQAILTAAGG